MKIGFSYWGFCEKFEDCNISQTPDGHRYGRPVFVKELWDRGHKVYSLQKMREKKEFWGMEYDDHGFPDIDVLFLEWRWPTYKNWGPDKFEPDLVRQQQLLDHYHGKIPIIAWDTDLKMTEQDEERWPNMIVADPTLNPRSFKIPRVRMTFWSDFKPLMNASEGSVEFGYVGNNYERDEMFRTYYSGPSSGLRNVGIQTKVWGNWLQRSPERESPESLIKNHKTVTFCDRVGFRESMSILNSFIATVHITKPRYAEQGFVSPRYLENIVTRTPGLVPVEFCQPDILGDRWTMSNSKDVVKAVEYLRGLNSQERNDIVCEQARSLLSFHDFSVGSVVDFIENVADNPVGAIKNA